MEQAVAEDEPQSKSTKPLIIAMKGHPGSGKSTLAHALASALKCPLLDKDDVRDATAALRPNVVPKLLNDLSYGVVWRFASTQLRLGLGGVVIDSPLSRRAHLDALLELAADAGARLVIVECKPQDEAEWRRRVERRGSADDASWHKPKTWAELQRLLEGYGGCWEYDVGDVPKVVLDTTAAVGVGELLSSVLGFIDSCSRS